MHILYIHQHFATPRGSSGTRSYEFARRWVAQGHKVTMLTGYYDIGGLDFKPGLIHRSSLDGINLWAVGTKYSNKQSFLRRIAAFITFLVFSVVVGLFVRKVDVVYATSTPLTIGVPALLIKWVRRIPYVFEVRDQWPAIPIQMGFIRNKLAIAVLCRFERLVYEHAGAVVALSPGMAEGVRSVTRKNTPLKVIPNSSDTSVFHPGIDGSAIRKQMGWNNELVFLHCGAMGKANDLDFVLEAAQILSEHKHIRFVLIGGGSEKASLAEKIAVNKLENVNILDSKPKSELPMFFAACDVSLVIFANYPILEHNSANKFFDSLSAGKPVLLNYSGWQREVIEANGAGFGCKLCDLDQFVERIRYFESHRDKLPEMGANARKLAEELFDRDKLAKEAMEVLVEAAKKN